MVLARKLTKMTFKLVKSRMGRRIIKGVGRGVSKTISGLRGNKDWDTKTNEKFSENTLSIKQTYNGDFNPPASPYVKDKDLRRERSQYIKQNNPKKLVSLPADMFTSKPKPNPINSKLKKLNEATSKDIKDFSKQISSNNLTDFIDVDYKETSKKKKVDIDTVINKTKDGAKVTGEKVAKGFGDGYWAVKENVKNKLNKSFVEYDDNEFMEVDLYDQNFQIVYDEPYHGIIKTPYIIDIYRGISAEARIRPRASQLKDMSISRLKARKIEGESVFIVCRKTRDSNKQEVILPIVHYTDVKNLNENQIIYLKLRNKYSSNEDFVKYNCNKIFIDASEENPAEISFIVAVE